MQWQGALNKANDANHFTEHNELQRDRVNKRPQALQGQGALNKASDYRFIFSGPQQDNGSPGGGLGTDPSFGEGPKMNPCKTKAENKAKSQFKNKTGENMDKHDNIIA